MVNNWSPYEIPCNSSWNMLQGILWISTWFKEEYWKNLQHMESSIYSKRINLKGLTFVRFSLVSCYLIRKKNLYSTRLVEVLWILIWWSKGILIFFNFNIILLIITKINSCRLEHRSLKVLFQMHNKKELDWKLYMVCLRMQFMVGELMKFLIWEFWEHILNNISTIIFSKEVLVFQQENKSLSQ